MVCVLTVPVRLYDSVRHDYLIQKLIKIGISSYFKLICNYVQNRKNLSMDRLLMVFWLVSLQRSKSQEKWYREVFSDLFCSQYWSTTLMNTLLTVPFWSMLMISEFIGVSRPICQVNQSTKACNNILNILCLACVKIYERLSLWYGPHYRRNNYTLVWPQNRKIFLKNVFNLLSDVEKTFQEKCLLNMLIFCVLYQTILPRSKILSPTTFLYLLLHILLLFSMNK